MMPFETMFSGDSLVVQHAWYEDESQKSVRDHLGRTLLPETPPTRPCTGSLPTHHNVTLDCPHRTLGGIRVLRYPRIRPEVTACRVTLPSTRVLEPPGGWGRTSAGDPWNSNILRPCCRVLHFPAGTTFPGVLFPKSQNPQNIQNIRIAQPWLEELRKPCFDYVF